MLRIRFGSGHTIYQSIFYIAFSQIKYLYINDFLKWLALYYGAACLDMFILYLPVSRNTAPKVGNHIKFV